jgi:hypothetical protein
VDVGWNYTQFALALSLGGVDDLVALEWAFTTIIDEYPIPSSHSASIE